MRTERDLRAALIALERLAPDAGTVLGGIGEERKRRHRARRLRRPHLAGLAAAGAVVAGAAVLAAVALPQAPPVKPGVYRLPAGTSASAGSAASARRILLAAAETVSRLSRAPTTGRYWVTPALMGNLIEVGPARGKYVILERVRDEHWTARSPWVYSPEVDQSLGVQLATAANRAIWRRDGSPTTWNVGLDISLAGPHGDANGATARIGAAPGKPIMGGLARDREPFSVGMTTLSARQLLALPADPARLKALLLRGYSASDDGPVAAYLFEITPSVFELPVTPAVRAALYRMLAELPGVRSLGRVRDVAGREGQAVELTGRYSRCGEHWEFYPKYAVLRSTYAWCVVQQRLVINPATGSPLSQELRYLELPPGQQWKAPDGLFSFEIFGHSHWTNADPPVKLPPR
jgi:hypothetical protein